MLSVYSFYTPKIPRKHLEEYTQVTITLGIL